MDEFVDHLVYHVGSGQAFFAGAALILAGLALSLGKPTRWRRSLRQLGAALGAILVAISATPLAAWFYALLAGVTLAWLIAEEKYAHARRRLGLARLATLSAWLVAAGLEAPYHVMPAAPPDLAEVYVIGDSVSAGMGENRMTTWPALLARQHDVAVHNEAQMGATVASARKQAARLPATAGLLVLAIGGNDLLGSTSAAQFAAGLDRLLADVCHAGRTVIMLELPLPPFRNEFGRIQRAAAAKHGVRLVPKRFLLGVLTTSGATRDGVHLSPAGQQRMADEVWRLLGGR
jgi:acyl-CoA thioesterase-1